MNIDECRVVLRPRTVSEVTDLALRVINVAEPRLYAALSAVVLLPALALCLGVHYVFAWEWAAVWALAITLGSLLQGVFTVAAGRLLFAPSLRVRTVLSHFFGRFWSYLGTWIASRFVLGLGMLGAFLVLPPFWVWTRFAFVHEASLLEQAAPGAALKRANRFVSARGSAALGLVVWFVCAQVGAVAIAELLGNVALVEHVLQLGQPLGALADDGGSPFALAGFFLSIPLVATARFLAYIDQRTRMDGWDIQLEFMAIAARDPRAPRTDEEEAA